MPRKASYAALGLLAIPIIFTILLIVMLGGSVRSSTPADCGSTAVLGLAPSDAGLDASQVSIAQQIVAAVRAFPTTADKPRAAVIALATARQESELRNIEYGDRDSLGVFQQRPSQGWGTPDQIMNVAHAATTFLQHLVLIPGWDNARVTDVAADVQHPAAAYRGLYQQWVALATRLTNELWPGAGAVGDVSAGCGMPAGADGGPTVSMATIRAQSWVDARVPYNQGLDFTNQYGTYRQDCSGFVSMAWGLPASLTTYSLPTVAHPIAKDQLRSGDIMLKPGHVVLFDKWANAQRTAYWDYEEQYPGTVAVHHVVPYPYWAGQGTFAPYRRD